MKNPIVPFLGLCALVQTSSAAPVTWTTGPTPTVNETSISLAGTLAHAGTWGDGGGAGPLAVVVGSETITFANAPVGNDIGSNNAITDSGYVYYDTNIWTPPGATNANFDRVMDGFATAGPNPTSVTLGNLLPGATYQVQLFSSDDRGCCNGRTQKWSDDPDNGVGTETSVYAMSTSSYVIGSFVADDVTQKFYVRGVSENSMAINAYVLRLIAAPDADGDQIPDSYEDAHPTILNRLVPGDATQDPDVDGLNNLQEYQSGTTPENPDTDGDGLKDGPDKASGASPLIVDTDSDGLSDFAEVITYNSFPNDPDSDNDNFGDAYEASAGSGPKNAASTPNGTTLTILGTGTAALLDSDLTDPENNGNDSIPQGSNFNWTGITSSNKSFFHVAGTGEAGAFDVFDNKVGNGEEKWCCDGVPAGGSQWVTVEFDAVVSLTHFTITTSGDSPQRDPRVWRIQGSNDGINFAPITSFNFPAQQIWTERNQVMRVDLPATALPYRFIRYVVFATGSDQHALGEIEYFGTKNGADVDGDQLPAAYEARYPGILSDGNAGDAAGNPDGDAFTNLEEFLMGTRPDLADSDADGLSDTVEFNDLGTDPSEKDTDRDGLTDGQEVNTYQSSPTNTDSDGDRFADGYEATHGGNPADPLIGAGAKLTSLGTGTNALLGRDVTDHENNGVEGPDANNSLFDWLTITATSKPFFHGSGGNEGAFDIFDNKVGGGEAKFYNGGTPVSVTVELPYTVRLTHFTMASGDDSPQRDPRVWSIQGSVDGVSFSPIFTMSDATTNLWISRQEVLRFDLPAAAPAYKHFRFTANSTAATDFQLGEIEFFGIEQDSDSDGMSDYFEDQWGFNPNNGSDAAGDVDGDGLSNLLESQKGGNPEDTDTDDDGLNDLQESNAGTKLFASDSDRDGFSDFTEVGYGSNPNDAASLPNFVPINWGTPTNITGALSDIKTNGTLVHAWSGGNAVTIQALGINFQTGPLLNDRYGDFDPFDRPGDNDYDTLLSNGSYGGSKFIEIPNLVPGQQYQVQIWVADTRDCCQGRIYNYGTYDVEDPSVDLNAGVSTDLGNNPGQYVVGTFTATQPSHFVYMTGAGGGSQYNAMMVRQISAPAAAPKIVHAGFNGTAFEITAANLDTAKSYKLQRGVSPASLADFGAPFTPPAAQHTLTDPAPPTGKAFYRVVEVSP